MLERVKDDQQKILPISFAQQRMWLLDRLEPGNSAYHIARATTFAELEGEPVQVIAAGGSLELTTIDLSDLPEPEREAETLRLARDDAQRPFDLAHGPLLRAKLLRLGRDEHVLVLVMHHIVTDAWSMSVLFREIGQLYEALALERPSPVSDLPIQYGDFARWQRESLKGEVLERHLAYWRRHLAGADPVLELPADLARPAVRTSLGATERVVSTSALKDRLKTSRGTWSPTGPSTASSRGGSTGRGSR